MEAKENVESNHPNTYQTWFRGESLPSLLFFKLKLNMLEILAYIALGITYICLQIVPIFYILTTVLDKEIRKNIKFEQWLLIPILILLMMVPFIGAVIGVLFEDENNKWVYYTSVFATYILLIIMIIKILL
jgi:hypothetical protein